MYKSWVAVREKAPIHHFEYDNLVCKFFTSCRSDVNLAARDIDIVDDDSMKKCSQCLAIEVMRELAE